MEETSLNAKRGIEGLCSFQSVLAHDLVNLFFLKVALMKHLFLNWDLKKKIGIATAKHRVKKKKEAQKD